MIIKITLLLITFVSFISLPALASVKDVFDNYANYKIRYPSIILNDEHATYNINQNIYQLIARFKDSYNNGDFYSGQIDYEIMYEDDKLLSIVFEEIKDGGDMEETGGDVYIYHHGFVYNKLNGNIVPLSYFVKIVNGDLKTCYKTRSYNCMGKKMEQVRLFTNRIPSDYYLLGNGEIALIFQYPELGGMWSDYNSDIKPATLRLSQMDIEYFNRRNKR